MIKDSDLGRGATFVRNPSYWRSGLPYVDQVKWEVGVDPALSVLRIERGDQDMMIEPVPKGSVQQLLDSPALKNQLVIALINDVKYFTISLKVDALKSLQVRQAMAMAVDKERLVRTLHGLGQPAHGGLFSPLSPYYQEGLGYQHDPQSAKQLLDQAGLSGGLDVTFWGINQTPFLELGQTVQQDLGAIGIRVNYQPMVLEAFNAMVVSNPAGLIDNEWPLPYPHGSYVMDGGFTSAAISAGCCNFSNYTDTNFDQLALQAHRTSDTQQIISLYKQMDRIVVKDQALWVPMIYPKRADFVSKRLRGFWVPSTPSADTRFFAKYWLEG
jgi:ABC-type transport system substrate-binding protein